MPAPRFAITAAPLDLAALVDAVADESAGGIGGLATFVGLVRRENLGRAVTHLEYEAYEPLALRALGLIDGEIRREWPSVTLGLHHRTGRLAIGEASVVIVAAAAHRAEAFAACRYAIERVKQIVPVWKHEHFEGGDVWIEGATADPADEAARAEARRRACA